MRAAPLLGDDVAVVLAGHPEPYDAELRGLAAALGLDGRVVFADYVPDADLEGLWALAGCAAFPTRAEGFGMPVLDALRARRAGRRSDLPVLHEVGGDAAAVLRPRRPGGRGGGRSPRPSTTPATCRGRPARGPRASRGRPPRAGTCAAYERALRADVRVGLNLVFLVPGRDRRDGDLRPRAGARAWPQRGDLDLVGLRQRGGRGRRRRPVRRVVPMEVVPVRARSRVQWVRGEQQHLPRAGRARRRRRPALAGLDRAAARALHPRRRRSTT